MNKPERRRAHLYRWHRRWQFDIPIWPREWLSIGWCYRGYLTRSSRGTLLLYWSPDATPTHPAARGIGRYA